MPLVFVFVFSAVSKSLNFPDALGEVQALGLPAAEVSDAAVTLFQVPELVPDDILEKGGAKQARQAFAEVPVMQPDELAEADAIIFGTGTRFGNMTAHA